VDGALLRRVVIISLGGFLAACNQTALTAVGREDVRGPSSTVQAPQYSALTNEKFPVPAVDADAVDPKYLKQRVRYSTPHPAGTIVVDPGAKFLYLVMEGGYAMRYGIGVGREGFGWSGTADIRRKAEWPTWTPPAAMIARQPELEPYRRGMNPGIQNPLGARALYLFQNGKDTLYRIHGTNEPHSIGKNVSSGCVRLLNHDVIDLFNRTPVGGKVVVLQDSGRAGATDEPAQHTPNPSF
jgi:lipoprotein-anchoring transpeptidase ErfK/SrfK